jgi:hypothetical protein
VVSAEGKNLENLEYELDHTPCQQVLEHGRYFDHRDVQARFPLDEFLVQMDFQSYLGVALADSTGHRLGVMSVMSRRPLVDPQTAELTLESEHSLRPAVEREPGLGRLDAAAGAVEQLAAEPLFERANLEADRRLRDSEPLGCLGEALKLDDRAERSELSRVHKTSLCEESRFRHDHVTHTCEFPR